MADSEKSVNMTQAELQELLKEIKGLRATVDKLQTGEGIQSARILKKITTHNVEVRRIDGKVVIGYRNRGSDTRPTYVYDRPDPKDPTKRVWMVDLVLEGMEEGEKLAIDFKEFRTESEKVVCRVIETKEKEWEIDQGMVKKKEVDGYSMVELDFDVPVMIVGKTRSFLVELPDDGNRRLEVNEAYVNIA